MKKECEIVQDLLFSYNDDVLSNSSKELVEQHLKTCVECKKVLQEIQEDNKKHCETKEIDYLKRIRKKLNRKTIYISIGIILLFTIIVFNLAVLKNYNETACLMEIYLDDNITDEQLTNIKESIMLKADNAEIEYRSKEQELERMKSITGGNSPALEGMKTNVLPASYHVKVNTKAIKNIENAINTLPGVKKVKCYIDDNPYWLFLYKK